jgi:hypothetical protein
MNNTTYKITLHQPVTYQIKIPGTPDKHWAEWLGDMTIVVEDNGNNPPITTLTGTFDQAALHGLLRRLYSMCLPLISVICVSFE